MRLFCILYVFLFALTGCISSSSVYPFELSVVGGQDCTIRCDGRNEPVVIVSQHCGYTEKDPLFMTNGVVNFDIGSEGLEIIGWDTEDLKEGGRVDTEPRFVSCLSSNDKKWWKRICEVDHRFSFFPVKVRQLPKAE
jgi:hypothetical protein